LHLSRAAIARRYGFCVDCGAEVERWPVVGWVEPPPGLAGLGVLWPYRPPLAGAIVAGKNLGRPSVFATLGHELGTWAAEQLEPLPAQAVITWVPANRRASRRRGFDQGRLLAQAVADALQRPARRLLVRRPASSRIGADRWQRLDGPDLRAPARPPSTVILVDDVCTTGASLRAGAGALRQAGARRVVALTVAQADGEAR
jgi:predicted amidophosphoribosyltransferase